MTTSTMVGIRSPFHKTMGSFDRIELNHEAHPGSEWLDITMHVGLDAKRITMTLRSDEAVRDLHYALSRYLDHISK